MVGKTRINRNKRLRNMTLTELTWLKKSVESIIKEKTKKDTGFEQRIIKRERKKKEIRG